MVTQFGMGTDSEAPNIRRRRCAALRDALWHNSLNVADAAGQPVDSMLVEVAIGVQAPEPVDAAALLPILPYGHRYDQRRRGRTGNHQDGGTGLDRDRAMLPRLCGSTSGGAAMPAKRIILEMGTGNDLHGGDYTKAAPARRARRHPPFLAEPVPLSRF